MKTILKQIDKTIWREELEDFVPEKVFDFHTHIFDIKHSHKPCPINPEVIKNKTMVTLKAIRAQNSALFPKRIFACLVTGWPNPASDLEKHNGFVRQEIEKSPGTTFGLFLVTPQTKNKDLVEAITKWHFVGLKPYKCFSRKDPERSRITDFLTEDQMKIANLRGLVITLHLSMKKGIGDPQNLADIEELSSRYPNIVWNLAHGGRCFVPENLEPAVPGLKKLLNRKIFYDTAAVTDSDVFYLLLSEIGPDRILYGSDDSPVGSLRGRCVGFGYDWLFVTEDRFPFAELKESFGRIEPTFMIYEEIRALKRAGRRLGLGKTEMKKIFYQNAEKIIKEVYGN